MSENGEKLSELAECFKKIRFSMNEDGKMVISESSMDLYEQLSENLEIVKENFKYFCERPSSNMHPDEFITTVKFLPEGNRILIDNLECILENMTNNAKRARYTLIDIPGISEKVADNFENIFNLMIYGKSEVNPRFYTEEADIKYMERSPQNVKDNLSICMAYIRNSTRANEILENNKELFINPYFNSSMVHLVSSLSQNPQCHEFIKNNFNDIKENCYVPDLAKLYLSIKEICPEEFEKEAFFIDNVYLPAKEKSRGYALNTNLIDKVCSRIIDQKRGKDIETMVNFLKEHATLEPNKLEVLGCGWFNIAIQAGDKVIKLSAPERENEKPKIPYHPRLLQPIVRKDDITRDSDNPIGIEIYEVVDMNTEISDEEILEVYKELREDGIKWTDIKRDNLGRLRKDNYPYEIGQNIPASPKSLGIEESGVERKILKAGQVVIIDLDYLEMAKDEKGNPFTKFANVPDCVMEYEKEYQNRINQKHKEEKAMPEEH